MRVILCGTPAPENEYGLVAVAEVIEQASVTFIVNWS